MTWHDYSFTNKHSSEHEQLISFHNPLLFAFEDVSASFARVQPTMSVQACEAHVTNVRLQLWADLNESLWRPCPGAFHDGR